MTPSEAIQLVGRGTLLLAGWLIINCVVWAFWEMWRYPRLDEIVSGRERLSLPSRVLGTLALGVLLGLLSIVGLSIWFAAMQPLCARG